MTRGRIPTGVKKLDRDGNEIETYWNARVAAEAHGITRAQMAYAIANCRDIAGHRFEYTGETNHKRPEEVPKALPGIKKLRSTYLERRVSELTKELEAAKLELAEDKSRNDQEGT